MRPFALAAVLAILLAGCASMIAASPARAQAPVPKVVPLVGLLTDAEAWRGYRARFVTESGRVVDTANGGISHSEGQGYGMLLAVAANDRATFDRVWGWTRANLAVRDDELLAWRWEPNRRPAVADMNNASDGDILVAWALTEAGEAWPDPAYKVAARRLAVELGRKLILPKTAHGPLLLPGIAGFAAEDRSDGPVVNLSYWVFPAFDRLPLVASEFDWAGLSRNGLRLFEASRTGPARLPTEWTSLSAAPRPADGFPPNFAHNAIRLPLYIAWAGLVPADVSSFASLWGKREARGVPVIEAASGRAVEWMSEAGYGALAALTACAASGTRFPAEARTVRVATDHYYPVTLHLLALIAAETRYPQCIRG